MKNWFTASGRSGRTRPVAKAPPNSRSYSVKLKSRTACLKFFVL
jgi:hypothetical protein